MKQILVFTSLISILLSLSCNNLSRNNKKNIEESANLFIFAQDSLKYPSSFNHNYLFKAENCLDNYCESIDSVFFYIKYHPNPIDSFYTENFIKKEKPCLSIYTNYGKVVFTDKDQEGDYLENYTYIGYDSCINYHFISFERYGSTSTILLNNEQYKSYTTLENIYLSSDEKLLIATHIEVDTPDEPYSLIEISKITSGVIENYYNLWSNKIYPEDAFCIDNILYLKGKNRESNIKWLKVDLSKLSLPLENYLALVWDGKYYCESFNRDNKKTSFNININQQGDVELILIESEFPPQRFDTKIQQINPNRIKIVYGEDCIYIEKIDENQYTISGEPIYFINPGNESLNLKKMEIK